MDDLDSEPLPVPIVFTLADECGCEKRSGRI